MKAFFRFLRVPYGLASAPSAFQKMMSVVLQGVPNVNNYLDDIICFGRTQSLHDTALQDSGSQMQVCVSIMKVPVQTVQSALSGLLSVRQGRSGTLIATGRILPVAFYLNEVKINNI